MASLGVWIGINDFIPAHMTRFSLLSRGGLDKRILF